DRVQPGTELPGLVRPTAPERAAAVPEPVAAEPCAVWSLVFGAVLAAADRLVVAPGSPTRVPRLAILWHGRPSPVVAEMRRRGPAGEAIFIPPRRASFRHGGGGAPAGGSGRPAVPVGQDVGQEIGPVRDDAVDAPIQ